MIAEPHLATLRPPAWATPIARGFENKIGLADAAFAVGADAGLSENFRAAVITAYLNRRTLENTQAMAHTKIRPHHQNKDVPPSRRRKARSERLHPARQ